MSPPRAAAPAVPLATMRPRSLWDILDDAFDLYRQKFVLFAGSAALVDVPAYALYIAVFTNITRQYGSLDVPENFIGAFGSVLSGWLLSAPFLYLAYVVRGGAIAIITNDMLLGRDDGVTIPNVYRRTVRHFLPLLLSSLFVILLMWLGFLALIIGALYVITIYAFVSQVVVLENAGPATALGRSRELCRGGRWTTFGLILLVGVITTVLSRGIGRLLEELLNLFPSGSITERAAQVFALQQVTSSAISILLAPILGIATTLLYYDFRVRREGLDIIAQAGAIGFPVVPDAFAPRPVVVAAATAPVAASAKPDGAP